MQRHELAENLPGDEEAQRRDQTDAQRRQGDRPFLLVDVHAGHHLAVAGQRWIAVAEAIEQPGDDDREDVAQRQGRHQDRDVVAGRLAEQLLVDLAHRYRAGAHAAAHDGHGDDHHRILRRETQQRAHGHGEQRGEQHRTQQWQGIARADLDQHLGVHAEDAAGDQRGYIEVEKAAALHEAGDVIGHGCRQPAEIDHRRGAEQRQDRAAAEVGLDDR